MAKFDWGFEIDNKADADKRSEFVEIRCTRTNTVAHFALSKHPQIALGEMKWGDCYYSTMEYGRENDAAVALETWGWI